MQKPPGDKARNRAGRDPRLLAANRKLATAYVLKDEKALWDCQHVGYAWRFWRDRFQRAICSRIAPLEQFARRLVAMDPPDWSGRLDELAREAQASLADAVRRGLGGGRYGLRTRLLAPVYLIGIPCVTLACGPVVIVKRMLFGRRLRPHPALGSGHQPGRRSLLA